VEFEFNSGLDDVDGTFDLMLSDFGRVLKNFIFWLTHIRSLVFALLCHGIGF